MSDARLSTPPVHSVLSGVSSSCVRKSQQNTSYCCCRALLESAQNTKHKKILVLLYQVGLVGLEFWKTGVDKPDTSRDSAGIRFGFTSGCRWFTRPPWRPRIDNEYCLICALSYFRRGNCSTLGLCLPFTEEKKTQIKVLCTWYNANQYKMFSYDVKLKSFRVVGSKIQNSYDEELQNHANNRKNDPLVCDSFVEKLNSHTAAVY